MIVSDLVVCNLNSKDYDAYRRVLRACVTIRKRETINYAGTLRIGKFIKDARRTIDNKPLIDICTYS